jgi:hypothetical protein
MRHILRAYLGTGLPFPFSALKAVGRTLKGQVILNPFASRYWAINFEDSFSNRGGSASSHILSDNFIAISSSF